MSLREIYFHYHQNIFFSYIISSYLFLGIYPIKFFLFIFFLVLVVTGHDVIKVRQLILGKDLVHCHSNETGSHNLNIRNKPIKYRLAINEFNFEQKLPKYYATEIYLMSLWRITNMTCVTSTYCVIFPFPLKINKRRHDIDC